jgi:hypothetical protein
MKTIYVKLLDEGTDVWRPVGAIHVGDLNYLIPHSHPYNVEDETWEFPPGSTVRVEEKRLSRHGLVWVAVAHTYGKSSGPRTGRSH